MALTTAGRPVMMTPSAIEGLSAAAQGVTGDQELAGGKPAGGAGGGG
jgi:hypothetical protein